MSLEITGAKTTTINTLVNLENYRQTRQVDIAFDDQQDQRKDSQTGWLMARVTNTTIRKISLGLPEEALDKLGSKRFWSGAKTAAESAGDLVVIVIGFGVILTAHSDESWKIIVGLLTMGVGGYHFVKDNLAALERNRLIDDIRKPVSEIINNGVTTCLSNNQPDIK